MQYSNVGNNTVESVGTACFLSAKHMKETRSEKNKQTSWQTAVINKLLWQASWPDLHFFLCCAVSIILSVHLCVSCLMSIMFYIPPVSFLKSTRQQSLSATENCSIYNTNLSTICVVLKYIVSQRRKLSYRCIFCAWESNYIWITV